MPSGRIFDGRSQSTVLGVALLLGITLAGAATVIVVGTTTLDDTSAQSKIARAEQSMTVFDAETAQVALGESSSRSVSFGQGGGDIRADPNAGHITITHFDHDGSGTDQVLYEADLGAVVFGNDGTTIAYQGGGVWRRDSNGGASMVSPPEFHYRQATLTLPVVRVVNDASGSGSVTGRITPESIGTDVYPDESETYDSDASKEFQNPIEHGQVKAEIESEYYRAWGAYFESRTEGTVTYDDANEAVTVELLTLGIQGSFDMPPEDNGISVRGMASGHSLSDFSITIRPTDTDSSSFNNLQWSMSAEKGNQRMELSVQNTGGGELNCGDEVLVSIYYSDDPTDEKPHEGWQVGPGDADAYAVQCSDLNGDGDDEAYLEIDFTDSSVTAHYEGISNSEMTEFSPNAGDLIDPSTSFGPHTADGSDYDSGDTESIDFVTAHYFALMGPDFNLIVRDQNAAGVGEANSAGFIDYGGGGRVVTFLHVTENDVEVEFN